MGEGMRGTAWAKAQKSTSRKQVQEIEEGRWCGWHLRGTAGHSAEEARGVDWARWGGAQYSEPRCGTVVSFSLTPSLSQENQSRRGRNQRIEEKSGPGPV